MCIRDRSTAVPSFYDIATASLPSTSSSPSALSSFFVAVADKGPVYVSSNAGASFRLSAALPAKLRGVAIGANGALLLCIHKQSTCHYDFLVCIVIIIATRCVSTGVGLAVGSRNVSDFGPVIFRSTNGSAFASWQTATLTNPLGSAYAAGAQLWAVATRNGQTAVAVGSYSTIFRSQDQGRSVGVAFVFALHMYVFMYVCMYVCRCV